MFWLSLHVRLKLFKLIACIVVARDFNLPDLDWRYQPAFPGTTNGRNTAMINFMNLFSLTQMVLKPTRENHILDLFLTSAPEHINSVMVIPGISDHRAVHCEMNFETQNTYSKKAREVFDYRKANVEEINTALERHLIVFETLADTLPVSELWEIFKKKIFELRDRFVPSWLLTERRNKSKPWYTKVHRLTQRRQRMFKAFKRNPSVDNQRKLKAIAKEVKNFVEEFRRPG